MVICSCRNIRESDYSTKIELMQRVLEDDLVCGSCREEARVYIDQYKTMTPRDWEKIVGWDVNPLSK